MPASILAFPKLCILVATSLSHFFCIINNYCFVCLRTGVLKQEGGGGGGGGGAQAASIVSHMQLCLDTMKIVAPVSSQLHEVDQKSGS